MNTTFKPCEEAIAWQEWKNSDDTQSCFNPYDFLLKPEYKQYLENRLNKAFMAGIKAGKEIKTRKIKKNFNALIDE